MKIIKIIEGVYPTDILVYLYDEETKELVRTCLVNNYSQIPAGSYIEQIKKELDV